MKLLIAVAFASLLPVILGLTINTPSGVVQCQPILLTWADGTPPYYLSILPGGQISAAAQKTFDSTNDTSLSWTVDIAAGTGITLQLRDSTGTIAYSNIVTIQSSSDRSSCLSSSTAGSAASGSTSASGSPTSVPSTSATSPATRSSASASGIASRTGTSATSAASASATNAASRGVVLKYVLAGIAGITGFGIVTAI